MLPYLADRPLSLYRSPRGIERESFFQKDLTDMPSEHIRSVTIQKRGKDAFCFYIKDVRGLVTLAQCGVTEIHSWGCRADEVERPDQIVFDLDPGPGVSWEQLAEGARGIRYLLDEIGLRSFAKTSGGAGLHVVVPLIRRSSWHEVKAFSQALARRIAAAAPRQFTASATRGARTGKVFIDYLRNVRGSTCVSAFSTRANAGARVSTPVAWDELNSAERLSWDMASVLVRLDSSAASWSAYSESRRRLTSRMLSTI